MDFYACECTNYSKTAVGELPRPGPRIESRTCRSSYAVQMLVPEEASILAEQTTTHLYMINFNTRIQNILEKFDYIRNKQSIRY
jgi:hypothetical protein